MAEFSKTFCLLRPRTQPLPKLLAPHQRELVRPVRDLQRPINLPYAAFLLRILSSEKSHLFLPQDAADDTLRWFSSGYLQRSYPPFEVALRLGGRIVFRGRREAHSCFSIRSSPKGRI